MRNRPNTSLLKNTYLEAYRKMERCLMKHNFSFLLPRKIENQVFDIMFTAQEQEVPTKKLECHKDLNKFCDELIHKYNKSISIKQHIFEEIFTFSLLMFLFILLDVLFEKGILIGTLITCSLVFVGYFTLSTLSRSKKISNSKIQLLSILIIVLLPFVLISFFKTKFAFLSLMLSFENSVLLMMLSCITTIIIYLTLSKKYDLFIFIKSN
jgi:DNA-binding ferritin-like protein (Dps family)